MKYEKYCFDNRSNRQTRKDLLIAFLEKHFELINQ